MGEEIACLYLKRKGYKIKKRNVRERFGEIDILAKDREGVLVFVEVKTLSGDPGSFTPEQHFNSAKAMRSKRIAMFYAGEHEKEIKEKAGWRVDLVTVLIKDPMLFRGMDDCEVKHYENV